MTKTTERALYIAATDCQNEDSDVILEKLEDLNPDLFETLTIKEDSLSETQKEAENYLKNRLLAGAVFKIIPVSENLPRTLPNFQPIHQPRPPKKA